MSNPIANTDIVYAEAARALTNSVLVAQKFDKNHRDVLESIRDLVKGCAENSATPMFEETTYIHPQNGQEYPMYVMNRDGFSLLVMGFTGKQALKFKLDFINAFNKMEEQLKSNGLSIPTTLPEALRLAADKAEEAMRYKELSEHKDGVIARLKPKADFADTAFTSDTLISISQAAKILKLPFGRNTLFKKLRESGVFFNNKNEPKQRFVDAGYFRMTEGNPIETSKGLMIPVTVYCTQKGLAYINHRFGNTNSNLPKLAKIG